MLDWLKSADKELFLFLNGIHNSFFDFVMFWASNRFIWIPFYGLMLYFLVRRFGKKTILILLLIVTMITASDQFSSGLVKNKVKRLRPCHDPQIKEQVHLVNGICGGQYGYFSSHAANSMALAAFLFLLFRRSSRDQHQNRIIFIALACYVTVVSYSRIYLGTHYPLDILTGLITGLILSFIFAQLFFRFGGKKN